MVTSPCGGVAAGRGGAGGVPTAAVAVPCPAGAARAGHHAGLAALTDTEGVVAWSRRGLLRRVADELGDLQRTRAQLRAVEADMVAVLGELGLSRLGDIPGLTACRRGGDLAETGDPGRYDSSSSLVKHAGLSPSENASGVFSGQAHISRRGRPGPPADRLARGMADAPAQPGDGRQVRRDDPGRRTAAAQAGAGSRQATAAAAAARARRARARVACAASLLALDLIIVVHDTSWDPAAASGPAACQHAARPPAEAA